jgi:flagellar export protein FliJ
MSQRQLETLLSARRRGRDVQRQRLATLLRRWSASASQHAALERDLAERVATLRNPESLCAQIPHIRLAYQYVDRVRDRLLQVTRAIAELQAEISAARRALTQFDREIELLSGLQDCQAAAQRSRTLAAEQRVLDDGSWPRIGPGRPGHHRSQFHAR